MAAKVHDKFALERSGFREARRKVSFKIK